MTLSQKDLALLEERYSQAASAEADDVMIPTPLLKKLLAEQKPFDLTAAAREAFADLEGKDYMKVLNERIAPHLETLRRIAGDAAKSGSEKK